jgi:hypothetical protein
MGFKANHGGAVGGRNVYLRDGRNQIAQQPAEIMISLVISLRDVGFLPVINYLRSLIVRHLDGGQSCKRRSGRSIALCPRVALVAAAGRLDGDGRIMISFTSHGERNGSDTKSSECEAVKDWKAREWK